MVVPVEVAEEDLVLRRVHGLSPLRGADVDPPLRNLGCHTLIATGVSADVAVPDVVFDAVNRGCTAVVPADAVAGCPPATHPAMTLHTLALVAAFATTDEVPACPRRPRGVRRA